MTTPLPYAVLRRIRAAGTLLQTKANHVLIEQGAHDRSLYLIEDGEVEVLRDGRRVARFEPGEMVGEIAFLDERPRTATVRTTKPSAFTQIDRADVARALSEDPEALWTWTCAVAERVRSRLDVAPDRSRTNVEAWLDDLARQSLAHRTLRHPYIEQLRSANFADPKAALCDFALHNYGFASLFPRYLTAALSRMDVHEHRLALLPALQECLAFSEEAEAQLRGRGIDPEPLRGLGRSELNVAFLQRLGFTSTAFETQQLPIVAWRELFLATLTQGSPAEAVGALYFGGGATTCALYEAAAATASAVSSLSPQDLAFVHVTAIWPPAYVGPMKAIVSDLAETPEGRRDLVKGMHKAMILRLGFFEFLSEQASAAPRA
jgi:hypothetical protein